MYKRTLKKSTVKNIHKFASKKCDKMMVLESSLEYDACFHFEFSKKIVTYEAQPIGFRYKLYGQIRSYTPDFLVTLDNEDKIFYEVKPFCKTQYEEFKLEFEAKQVAALDLGIKLELITEKQTLVIYMGLLSLPDFIKELVEHGQNKTMPVAVIQSGTTNAQRVIVGNIGSIKSKVVRSKIKSPALAQAAPMH